MIQLLTLLRHTCYVQFTWYMEMQAVLLKVVDYMQNKAMHHNSTDV